LNNYKHWLNDAEAPENMDTFCRQPLYITLQEYVSCTEKPALSGRLETGQCVKRVDASLPSAWEERDVSGFLV
jgi:hypothetical protein